MMRCCSKYRRWIPSRRAAASAGAADTSAPSASVGSGAPADPSTGAAPSGAPGRRPRRRRCLGEANLLAEVDVLNGVQDLDALLHGFLERLPAGNETHAAGA